MKKKCLCEFLSIVVQMRIQFIPAQLARDVHCVDKNPVEPVELSILSDPSNMCYHCAHTQSYCPPCNLNSQPFLTIGGHTDP